MVNFSKNIENVVLYLGLLNSVTLQCNSFTNNYEAFSVEKIFSFSSKYVQISKPGLNFHLISDVLRSCHTSREKEFRLLPITSRNFIGYIITPSSLYYSFCQCGPLREVIHYRLQDLGCVLKTSSLNWLRFVNRHKKFSIPLEFSQ